MTTRAEFIKEGKGDGTCRPIFLLQMRLFHVCHDQGWVWDEDLEAWKDPSALDPDQLWTELDMFKAGVECIREEWIPWGPEAVWSNRADAEAYGKARAYNAPDGWRVYCMPCFSRLVVVESNGRLEALPVY